ncbi:MAG: S8 family serine peptidase [Planctomycetota bacterium]|nr:S8 family serine peptidase [Planctomycetota bacterium]
MTQHARAFAVAVGLAFALGARPATALEPNASFLSAPDRPAPLAPALAAAFEERDELKVWVMFVDKGVAPGAAMQAALAGLEATYPARAVERRRLRRSDPGLFDERDLPVHAGYTAQLGALGVRVLRESRWANAASVRVTRVQAEQIAALPFVRSIEPVRWGRGVRPVEVVPAAHSTSGGYGARDMYGRSSAQLAQINLPALHGQGFTGQGVIVGILDTGFRRDHAAFNFPGHVLPVVAEHDFIDDDTNTGPQAGDHPDQHSHGTLILGCIRAYQPNELVGGAYDASVILAKTEDIASETPIEEDNYVAGLEFIEFHGGDLATSSLSYIDWYTQADLDGVTAVTSIAVNVATANGLHCLTAAGNAGHDDNPATSTLGAPADALRVITCGAGRSDGTSSGFTSSGPTADGRVKPEVLARGSGTATVSSSSTTGFALANGTSLSTPLVAAAVACIVQARPTWTVDQMRAAIFSNATDYVATGMTDPLFIRGYGFIDAAATVGPICDPDVNQDGNVDQDDVACLAQVIAGDASCSSGDPDFNQDGNADQDDVESLSQVVGGQACP